MPSLANLLRATACSVVLTATIWAQPLTVPAGTAIPVRLTTAISTKTQATGSAFAANLDQDLVVNGRTVARRGAPVRGVVAYSTKGGRVKGKAQLSLRLTSLQMADGHNVAIATSTYGQQARATKKKDAAKIGGGAALGAAIGAIAGGGAGAAIGAAAGGTAGTGLVMSTRGDQVTIPSESRMTFRLRAPVTIR